MLQKFWKKNRNRPAFTPAASSAQTTPGDLFRASGDDRLRNEDYNGAVVMYDEALRCIPTDVALLLSRSLAHMMSTPPELDLALQDVGAAIQHEPTSSQGWIQKGEIHLKMEDIKDAEEAFVKAVEFSQGLDRHKAQRCLRDVRSQRDQTSSITVEPQASGTSCKLSAFPHSKMSV
jgi:tetratricopeptide (TPR) repeat protein